MNVAIMAWARASRLIARVPSRIASWIGRFLVWIWRTPSHFSRWAAVVGAMMVMFVAVGTVPWLSWAFTTGAVDIAVLCLVFYALAATLIGGRR